MKARVDTRSLARKARKATPQIVPKAMGSGLPFYKVSPSSAPLPEVPQPIVKVSWGDLRTWSIVPNYFNMLATTQFEEFKGCKWQM